MPKCMGFPCDREATQTREASGMFGDKLETVDLYVCDTHAELMSGVKTLHLEDDCA